MDISQLCSSSANEGEQPSSTPEVNSESVLSSTPAPAQTHSIPYNPITDSFQEQQQRRQPQLHLDSPRSLPRALLPPQTTSQAHNTSPSSPSRSHFTSDIPHISQPLSTPPVQPPAPPTLPAFRSVNNPSQRELALNRAIDQCNQLCAELRRQFDFPAADTRLASLELFTQTGFGEHPATRELPLDVTAGVPMSSNRSSSHTSNQASALHVRQGMNMAGRMCHSCHTTQTPEWRRGPDGARTLCNACGLRMSYQRYVLQINQLVLDFRLLQVAATTLTHDSTASSTDCFYHSYTDKSDI